MIWQRRRVQALLRSEVTIIRRARYIEPDSIPIDTRPAYDMAEMEEAYQTDHVFAISEASMDDESRARQAGMAETEPDQADDLEIIEGIGPRIASLLTKHGITRFDQLALTPHEQLTEILTKAKINHISDPATWSEQARLAAAQDWDGLKQLQDALKGGRRKA
jgi:predicted flap endonuclease-1-like 5' DNA nuclease